MTNVDTGALRSGSPRVRIPWLVWPAIAIGVVVSLVVTACAWIALISKDASEGAVTPDVAVLGAMWGLDRWNDDFAGVRRYLLSDRSDELAARLLDLKARFAADDPTYAVEAHNYEVVMHDEAAATVTVMVALRWNVPGERGLWMTSKALPWTFDTVLVSGYGAGWKVSDFRHPDICLEYIRCAP